MESNRGYSPINNNNVMSQLLKWLCMHTIYFIIYSIETNVRNKIFNFYCRGYLIIYCEKSKKNNTLTVKQKAIIETYININKTGSPHCKCTCKARLWSYVSSYFFSDCPANYVKCRTTDACFPTTAVCDRNVHCADKYD